MDKREEGWMLAAFEQILETGNLTKVEIFLEKNPQIIAVLERRAEENEIESGKWKKMEKESM